MPAFAGSTRGTKSFPSSAIPIRQDAVFHNQSVISVGNKPWLNSSSGAA